MTLSWPEFRNMEVKSNEILPPRRLEDYEEWLGFKREDLSGKKVLDLGSHKEKTLETDLKNSGIQTEVISLSRDFAVQKPTEQTKTGITPIAALAEELPFKNNSFDYILDLAGPSIYSTTFEDIIKRLYEEVRVLKPGGKSIFVINNEELKNKYEIFKNLLELETDLEKVECKIEDLKIPGYYRFTIQKDN